MSLYIFTNLEFTYVWTTRDELATTQVIILAWHQYDKGPNGKRLSDRVNI